MSGEAAAGESEAPASRVGGAWLLALLTALVFAPAVGAGWLAYDDDWLIERNPLLTSPDASVLRAIFLDLTLETRVTLGAEYLPVRDVLVWLLYGVLGVDVALLHAAQVALYVAAVLVLRSLLLVVLGRSARTELVALLFALHPVHAESVVWLAGIKDVIALLFSMAALRAYVAAERRVWWVLPFALLALFSKGMAVIIPALLLATDLLLARRPRFGPLVGVSALTLAALAVHVFVGGVVGMLAEPLGDTFAATAASMSVVFLRYVGLSLLVLPNSVFYEVEVHSWASPTVWLALATFGLASAVAVERFRRGERALAYGLAVFLIGLAPVSQLLAPLQNRMADRYLFVAVLGPLIAVAYGAHALLAHVSNEHLKRLIPLALVAAFAVPGALRAMTFADPVRLFAEATDQTRTTSGAPYQLAMQYQLRGDVERAMHFFRVAYERDTARSVAGRRAGNNLGRLLYQQGRLAEALALYRDLYAHYPSDPRVLRNLAQVLRTLGEVEEAQQVEEELVTRFPDYERDRLDDRAGPLGAIRGSL